MSKNEHARANSTINISRFRINGLHGTRNVDLEIDGNQLVLVGSNGLGKTTVLTLFYLFLSRQWIRLAELPFESLELVMNSQPIRLTKVELAEAISLRHDAQTDFWRHLPLSIRERIRRTPELFEQIALGQTDERTLTALARYAGLSPREVERFLLPRIRGEQLGLFARSPVVRRLEDALQPLDSQIVYLPTYRRIERDLESIFPELEDEVRAFNRRRSRQEKSASNYIELVEFGMEDVTGKIEHVLHEVEGTARSELNALAGSYLREVIRGQADVYEQSTLASLSDDTVEQILGRVEEKTLDYSDKTRLKQVLTKLRSSTPITDEKDKYAAHFFSKLMVIHEALGKKEADIARFVRVCNEYLDAVRLHYDERTYKVRLSKTEGGEPIELELSQLSSGEKQIVSLFAHLYLDGPDNFAVLIDEPELSLSVEWQKRFLPDILDTGRCRFLFAATHSPFIFDNALDPHTRDLRRFVEATSR